MDHLYESECGEVTCSEDGNCPQCLEIENQYRPAEWTNEPVQSDFTSRKGWKRAMKRYLANNTK